MSWTNDGKDRDFIEEQAATIRLLTDLTEAGSWVATIRLLTDLTEAGSWVINFMPVGSLASVQWGDGFRRLMGYRDQGDFPNEFESFARGIHPEDKDAFLAEMTASVFDKNIMRTAGKDFRFFKKDGTVRWFRSRGFVSRDPEGRPVQCRGVTIDITNEKEHDALYIALQNEAASLDTIHEMLGSGKWTMDFDEAGTMVRVSWSDEFRRTCFIPTTGNMC